MPSRDSTLVLRVEDDFAGREAINALDVGYPLRTLMFLLLHLLSETRLRNTVLETLF